MGVLSGWLEIALFLAVLTAITPVLGRYMHRVFAGERTLLTPVLTPVERGTLRLLGDRHASEMDWRRYATAVLAFSLFGIVLLFAQLMLQSGLPMNPRDLPGLPFDLAFNTSISFVTNTNWQFYAGETTMSNLTQMAGLAVQNFLSAAVGLAVAIAVVRGLARRSGSSLGNFWQDLVRAIFYVLLPGSILLGLFFVSQGVIQTLATTITFHPVIGGDAQTLITGPVASQEAIKMLGTNGGGFFNVNSAMPFENPTAWSNFAQMLAILAIPAALTSTFGRMVGSRRQGWAIYTAMLVLFISAVAVIYIAESHGSPALDAAGITGGNLEGKDVRFGLADSSLFAAVTTAASCGAVNAAMEAFTGFGGLVPMGQMSTGEVIFGGVGSGLYGMLLYVLLAVFLSGLMVGRTPEYLGKKIGAKEIKLVIAGTVFVPLMVLALTALAAGTEYGAPSIFNSGPQGFSETLYAYLSQGNNNGSAFAGYTGFVQGDDGVTTITFANVMGGLAMLFGRFVPLVAALAVAGAMAGKRVAPPSTGTLRTDDWPFVLLLIATILIVALLTFVPALLLGPAVQGLSGELY